MIYRHSKTVMVFIARIALVFSLITTNAFAFEVVWDIKGVDEAIKVNIQKRLVASRKVLGIEVSSAELKRFTEESRSDVELAVAPFGYFHPIIHINLNKQRKNYQMLIAIKPGPRVMVTDVRISLQGQGQIKNHDLLKQFTVKPNTPLSIPGYQEAKARVFNQIQARGYIKVSISHHEILIDRVKNTAKIIVVYDTGDRYYFGPVHFTHNPMETKLLGRHIPFHLGDPYSSALLLKMQDNLLRSHYFQSVSVEPDMNAIKNHQIPLTVKLVMRKAKLYIAGLGYSTDIGPRGTLGIDWRRLNVYGHRLQAVIKGSNRYYDFQAQYSIPGHSPVTDVFTIATSVFHHKVGLINSKGFNAAAAYTERWHQWQRTFSLKFLRELSYNDNLMNHNTTWLYPEIRFKKIISDNEINPNNGFRMMLTSDFASKRILANDNFWQIHADGKYIRTLKTKTRLLLNAEAGATWVKDVDRLAPTLQFYAGGTQSVRGFNYQGLGPGKFLVQGSVELQQPVYKEWSIAGFYDVGNAFDSLHDFKLEQSIGMGVVRRSPIGSINIGVARRLSHSNPGVNLTLSFGPDL